MFYYIANKTSNRHISITDEFIVLKMKKINFVVAFFSGSVIFTIYTSHSAIIQEESTDDGRPVPVMLCYYGSWATYRPGIGKFDVENIDTSLCTHIIYAFMGLRNGIITSLDEYNDYEEGWGKGSLKRFSSLAKNNGIKALVAIGGWNEGSVNYSMMASTDEGRNTFADSTIEFIKKFNFDGLDLDWEYPTQRGGIPQDKENFSLLLQILSEKLHSEGLMLTVAVTANPIMAEIGYDFEKLARYADYVSILSFDYHTASSDNFTGLIAPLNQFAGDHGIQFNLEYSVNKWLEGGVPASKLIVGIPLYGRTFTLKDATLHNIGDPIVANGTAGQYTREPGCLAYYEICMDSNWEVVRNEGEHYLYAYHNDQWISYDDVSTIIFKTQFVMDKGLAGMMAWALDYDDYYNICGAGANPLLTATNEVMRSLQYGVRLGSAAAQKAADSTGTVLCYWGSWSTYRPSIALFEVNNIDANLCTHVIYAYAGLRNGVIASLDEYNDFEEAYGKGTMKKFITYARNNGLKALLGLGGWNEGSTKYSQMASSAAGREAFADSVVAFLQEHGFQGLSFDWEYPSQRGGVSEDKENYVVVLQTLQEKFAEHDFILTVGVGIQPEFAAAYDMVNIAKYVDYIIVQSYDYHTYIEGYTAVSAPLSAGNAKSVENSIKQWVEAGVPVGKLIVGMAAYGRTGHLADANKHELGDWLRGPGTAGQFTQEEGLLSYLEYCTGEDWVVEHSDDPSYTYAYRGNQWISYDDPDTLQAKAQYAKDNGLGGIMMYSLESDDFHGNCGTAYPLLTAINRGLGRL